MRTAMLPRPSSETTQAMPPSKKLAAALPTIWPWLLLFFHRIAERRLARSFRAVRVANSHRFLNAPPDALVVALNHPSWWDPLVGFLLSRGLFPSRNFYAPMDEEALRRYRIFRHLGMFPVAMHSARGAAQFLRTADQVLAGQHILAVTPQGQFTDVRSRPVVFRSGLAALLRRRSAQGKATTVLPLALEYTFWDQRLPEVLVNCGSPLLFAAETQTPGAPSQQWVQTTLEQAMEQTQDELATLALTRDAARFRSLLEGRRGSAGFYGWIERFRSVLQGRSRSGDHTAAGSAAHSHTMPPKG